MPKGSAKRIPLILLMFGVVAVVVDLGSKAGRARPMEVSAKRAMRQDVSSWISSNGKLEPIEPHVLQAQITAFIDRVLVKEGQTVSQGQTIATLDTRDLRAELIHANDQLRAAESDQRLALKGGPPEEAAQIESDFAKAVVDINRFKKEYESKSRLYAKNAITKQEMDQAKTDLDRAEAEKMTIEDKKRARTQRFTMEAERAGGRVEDTRASIRALEAKLGSAEIKAPVSGVLYALPARAGSLIHAGDAIAELADLKRVRVRAFVDEPELGSLSAGQAVEITWDATPNRKWPGQVEQLPKTVVPRGSRSVGEVLCSVGNADLQLLPNINVNVRIRTAERDNVLAIPRGATHSDGDKRFVFVVDQGKLRKREVTLGISNATMYEVLGGVSENDLIALTGTGELQDGLPVGVRE